MKTRDSYIKFKENIDNKINYYHNELLFAINMSSTFSNAIMNCNNEKVVNYFKDIYFLDTFNITNLKDFDIEPILYSTIKRYHSYVSYKVPHLMSMLDNYSFLQTIPYIMYYELIGIYNAKISRLVLQGYDILISKIGRLKILCKPKVTKRPILDYNKTKINKQYFKDNNITGDYRVYNNDDEFSYFKYNKSMTLQNLKYYHFEPTDSNNMKDRKIENYYSKTKTDNEILDNTKIGNLQKMNCLLHQDVRYKLKYIQNAN